MFSIDCLEIFDACDKSLRKNLIPGKFSFNNRYDKDGRQFDDSLIKKIPNFWGDKINVQAIVGKNGSGKSTLLDLMYMAINNFAYMYGKIKNSESNDLIYIPRLCVALHFSLEEINYNLYCDDYSIELFASNNSVFSAFIKCGETKFFINALKYEDCDIVKNFFYSSVTNFSMQSYYPLNYYIYESDAQRFFSAKYKLNKDCYGYWLERCFHKNDGYRTPIVINPNRTKGQINLWNLMHVSKDYATSLYIYARCMGLSYFEPYRHYRLEVFENIRNYRENVLQDYSDVWQYVKNKTLFTTTPTSEWVDEFINNILNKTLVKKFIDFFDIRSAENTPYYKFCIAYLAFKIWKIVKKVPLYKKFRDYVEFQFDEYGALDVVAGNERVDDLLYFIKDDTSYVAKKIRRTVNFLKLADGYLENLSSLTFFDNLSNKKSIFYNGDALTPSIIDSILPPPIFSYNLKLTKLDESKKPILVYLDKYIVEKKDEKLFYHKEAGDCVEITDVGKVKEFVIDYQQLSSGEIQLIQTISSQLYHLLNLVSSQDSASQYKYFNLVFDEVEICLHPEYQRQFISRLISALTAMNINSSHFVNIFIVTHSPFLLSDIPLKQILFLEDGMAKEKIMNTFAGNIGEMMYDSFFMRSTIGEFSEEKLKRIIRIRQGKNPKKNADGTYHNLSELPNDEQDKLKKECEDILKMIGDSVIRSLVEEVSA